MAYTTVADIKRYTEPTMLKGKKAKKVASKKGKVKSGYKR